MGATRACAICEEVFPETSEYFFYADGAKRSRLRLPCKDCDRKKRRFHESKRRARIEGYKCPDYAGAGPEISRDQAWAAYLHNRRR